MKKITKIYLSLLTIFLPFTSVMAEFEEEINPDTIMGHMWDSYNQHDYERAIAFCDGAIREYSAIAKKQQAALKSLPKGEEALAQWALNIVGTAYYIKGQSLFALRRNDESVKAFMEGNKNYKYAQCWDPRGWFWKPAVKVKR